MFTSCIAVLSAWLDGVNRGDLEGVLDLYHKEATLLPTYSPKLVDDRAGLKAYFVNFTAKPNLKAHLHEETLRICQPTESIAVAAGFYTFSYDLNGKPHTALSRFTFALNLNETAPILHHHSSESPVAPD